MTPRPAKQAHPARAAAGDERQDDSGTHEHELAHQRAERQAFWRWGRIAFILASLFLVVQLLHTVQSVVDAVLHVLLLVVFGGLLAVIVAPLDRLLGRRMAATPATLLSLLAALVVVGGVGYFIAIGVVGQVQQLSHHLADLERPLQDVQRFLDERGLNVSIAALGTSLGINATGAGLTSAIVSALSFTVQLLIDVVIVLISAFWLLRDRLQLRRGAVACLPARWRVESEFGLDAAIVVFGGYLRGQLVLAALVGVLALGGCALLGVPFPVLVGFAAGVFELIPLAGPFVGGAIALLFALTVSPVLALETGALFVVIHVIEGYVVAPRVQGRFVRLHPLVTLLALIAGVYAGGFLGAFLAVPVASLVAVLVRARLSDLRDSEPELFLTSSEDRAAVARRRRLLGEYRVGLTASFRRAVRWISGGAR